MFDDAWATSLSDALVKTDLAWEHDDLVVLFAMTNSDAEVADAKGRLWFQIEVMSGQVTLGKMKRGTKPAISVTLKEPTWAALWTGDRNYDEAFMSGDLKVEGAYHVWLDQLTPLFVGDWAAALETAATSGS